MAEELEVELKPEIDLALPAAQQFARCAELRAAACIALEDAILCVNCSVLYERFSAQCPKCASEARWDVARGIGTIPHIKEVGTAAPGAVEDATGRP